MGAGKLPAAGGCSGRIEVRGYEDAVGLLVAKDADVNAKDKDDRMPLWRAKKKGHKETVELLSTHGGKLQRRESVGIGKALPRPTAFHLLRKFIAGVQSDLHVSF